MKTFFAATSAFLAAAVSASASVASQPVILLASPGAGPSARDVATTLGNSNVPVILLADSGEHAVVSRDAEPECQIGGDTNTNCIPNNPSFGNRDVPIRRSAQGADEREAAESLKARSTDKEERSQPVLLVLDPAQLDSFKQRDLQSRGVHAAGPAPVILLLDPARMDELKNHFQGLQARSEFEERADKPVILLLSPEQLQKMGGLHVRSDVTTSKGPVMLILDASHLEGMKGMESIHSRAATEQGKQPMIVLLDASQLGKLRGLSNSGDEVVQNLLGPESMAELKTRSAEHGVHRPVLVLLDPSHLNMKTRSDEHFDQAGVAVRDGPKTQDFDTSLPAPWDALGEDETNKAIVVIPWHEPAEPYSGADPSHWIGQLHKDLDKPGTGNGGPGGPPPGQEQMMHPLP